jgi:hypothetical protein
MSDLLSFFDEELGYLHFTFESFGNQVVSNSIVYALSFCVY